MMQNKGILKTIGITGGIGAGKSQVLDYIEKKYNCIVLKADLIANQMKVPGCDVYQKLVALLGKKKIDAKGGIENQKMAGFLFSDKLAEKKTKKIIHPAVKQFILKQIECEKKRNHIDFLFVEAALLLEEHYDEILDEIWYIYANCETRRTRLKESRGYADDRITKIMSEQLPEKVFRHTCKITIDNSGEFDTTIQQIDQILGDYLCQK